MHALALLSVFFLISPFAPGHRDPEEEAIKTAIQAAGGEDVLTRFSAGHVSGKGTLLLAGQDVPFTFEEDYELPGRFRIRLNYKMKSETIEMIQVVNGGIVRQCINGKATPLNEPAVKELRTAAACNEIGLLRPLLKDKKYSIHLEKSGHPAEATHMGVCAQGLPEIRISFDRSSGHLIQMSYKSFDGNDGKEHEIVSTFEDFKAVSGLTRFMKSTVVRDGHKLITVQIEKVIPLEKVDPQTFSLEE